MSINPVDILNTGVTGFAFLMLYLGYRLTSEVQRKILEKSIDFPNETAFEEWKELVVIQLNNTRYFLAFAALFFVGGLLILMYAAKSDINVEYSPVEIEAGIGPTLLHQGESVDFSEHGTARVSIYDHETLRLVIKDITEELIEARQEKRRLEGELTKRSISKANSSTDSGFGFAVLEK